MDDHTRDHLRESPFVVVLPLVMLAIPSVIIGAIAIEPMLFGSYFKGAIYVAEKHNVVGEMAEHWHGIGQFVAHGLKSLPFLLAISGIGAAWLFYMKFTHWPDLVASRIKLVYQVLVNKYGFDRFNEIVFAGGARKIGNLLWSIGDVRIIDGLFVNGSARVVGLVSAAVRQIQSGYLYHYAFAMIIGLFLLMTFFLHG